MDSSLGICVFLSLSFFFYMIIYDLLDFIDFLFTSTKTHKINNNNNNNNNNKKKLRLLLFSRFSLNLYSQRRS